MKREDNVLQEMKALSLGPSWSEKRFDTSTQELVTAKFEKKKTSCTQKRKNSLLNNIDISLKPTTELMDLLVQTMKKTCITYRFFPIVNFFLQKKEYKIVLTALKNNSIFCTFVDNLPFLNKEKAEEYLVDKYWNDFFIEESVTLSKPKGAFTSINRCGITNILLGPPNYHLYSDLLREHYDQYLKDQYSWEVFLENIRNESHPDIIRQWIDSMSRGYRYHLKQDPEIIFENRVLAKQHLLQNISFFNDGVRGVKQVVLLKEKINEIIDKDLKEGILQEIDSEMTVPIKIGYLCSARFRHAGFHVYKKGHDAEKVTYVCSIKRRIRDEYTSFSKDLENIVECIENHPRKSLEAITKYYFNVPQDAQNYLEIIGSEAYVEFTRNLFFLIQQGWITKYEDGLLYVSPKQTFASKNNQKYA